MIIITISVKNMALLHCVVQLKLVIAGDKINIARLHYSRDIIMLKEIHLWSVDETTAMVQLTLHVLCI